MRRRLTLFLENGVIFRFNDVTEFRKLSGDLVEFVYTSSTDGVRITATFDLDKFVGTSWGDVKDA